MPKRSLAEEAAALLDGLDKRAASAGTAAQSLRRAERFPYRRETRLQQRDPGGYVIDTWAFTRDLSAGGLGCVHCEEMATGTAVQVSLVLPVGTAEDVPATVVHCQRLRPDWYLLGLKFDQPIDPKRYVLRP